MGSVARIARALEQMLQTEKLDSEDLEALQRLAEKLASLGIQPYAKNSGGSQAPPAREPGPDLDKLREEALRALREKLLDRLIVKMAGWAWKRKLYEYRAETGTLLPPRWAEEFSLLVAPDDKELVEAVIRRWLWINKYCAEGKPLPGSDKKPDPVQRHKCTVLMTLIETARGLLQSFNDAPPKLREAMKLAYVAALANTMLGRTPDIQSFIDMCLAIKKDSIGYFVENMAKHERYITREEAERMIKYAEPDPVIWLATGYLYAPPRRCNTGRGLGQPPSKP